MTSQARILFVDDEKRVLNSMRGLFRRDFELFLTTEGATAVQMASENSIDVIVADQRMPGMTGVEVLEKVKQVSPTTIRILLTGYADLDAIEGSINVGEVFRFLSKPCPPKLLRETLQLAIDASRASSAAISSAAQSVPSGADPAPAAAQQDPAQDTGSPAGAPQTDDAPSTPTAEVRTLADLPLATTEPPKSGPGEDPRRRDGESDMHRFGRPTEIVLASDNSGDIHRSSSNDDSAADPMEISVAVFTNNPEFAESTIRALSPARETFLATTLVKVVEVLEEHRTGVLVTDFTSDATLLQSITSTLKQQLPELVTIVVSESRDTSDMINLINYGQVFRFVAKPIIPTDFRQHVNAAAVKHMQFLEHPELLQRHQVVDMPAAEQPPTALKQFVGQVMDLRGRWSERKSSSH